VGCINSVATPDVLICRRIEFVHPTASTSVTRPISRSVVSETSRLPRSIARLKIALGCPSAGWAAICPLPQRSPLHDDLASESIPEVGALGLVEVAALPGRQALVDRDPGQGI
jgi:hypothetical protein